MASFNSIIIPKVKNFIGGLSGFNNDQTLPGNEKLPVLFDEQSPSPYVIQNAIVWCYRNISNEGWALGAIHALFYAKLLHKVLDVPDGHWKTTQVAEENIMEEEIASINKVLTAENSRIGLQLILSTKVNFWLISSHIERRTPTDKGHSCFTRKIFMSFFYQEPTDSQISVIETLGRYASTKAILRAAKINDIEPTVCYDGTEGVQFTFPEDGKLRLQELPAGTRRLAICHAATVKLKRSIAAKFTPDLSDFDEIERIYALVHAHPAKYHTEAFYLTGKPRENYNDLPMDKYMGRLGTFLRIFSPASDLCKSHHFKKSKIHSYEDYDPEYERVLWSEKGKLLGNEKNSTEKMDKPKGYSLPDSINPFRKYK